MESQKNRIEEEVKVNQFKLAQERQKFEEYKELEKASLSEGRRELEKLSSQLKREREFVEDQQLKTLKKIKLDVGGKAFTTSITTLTSKPESMLAAMFSGRFSLEKDEDGSFFIDRNGKNFELILDWLRDESIPSFKEEAEKEKFLKDCQYFQLNDLYNLIESEFYKSKRGFQFQLDNKNAGSKVIHCSNVVAFTTDSGIFGDKQIPKDQQCYWEVKYSNGDDCFIGIGRKGIVNLETNLAFGCGICFRLHWGTMWREGQTIGNFKRIKENKTVGILVDLPNRCISLYCDGRIKGTIVNIPESFEYFPLFGGCKGIITIMTGLQPPVNQSS
jgi:hypothetical protein